MRSGSRGAGTAGHCNVPQNRVAMHVGPLTLALHITAARCIAWPCKINQLSTAAPIFVLRRTGGRSAVSVPSLAVAGLDEAALRLERSDVGAGELLGNFAERVPAGGEAFDQPLIHGLVFTIALAAVRRRARAA